MALKTLVTKTTVVALSALVLAACGGGTTTTSSSSSAASSEATSSSAATSSTATAVELKDGTYTLKSNEDSRGWAVDFTLVVKDGKITESNFDYVNAAGDKKSADEGYNSSMKEKAGVSAAEAMEQLNAALVESQDVSTVEVVSGATHTSDSFIEYAKLLVEAAAEGNTETITVELPAEQ